MLPYPAYSQLFTSLKQISTLSDELRRPGGNYYKESLAFLEKLQKLSDDLNIYIGADIAIAIEKLLVFKPKPTSDSMTRPNPRKERDAYAVQCMEVLFSEIKAFLTKYREVYDQCIDLWRQVLARLKVKYSLDEDELHSEHKLNYLLAIISADPELAQYYTHITGLVGSVNAKILLDITLPELEL